MASKRLRRLAIPDSVVGRLKQRGITHCNDLLSQPEIDLLEVAGLTLHEARHCRQQAAFALAPKPVTAWHRLQEDRLSHPPLRSSHADLDACLKGGFLPSSITELVGPCGCGKTQFCTLLSIMCTRQRRDGGLNGAVVYIDTEGSFSAERLVEMAQHRFPDDYVGNAAALMELAGRVRVLRLASCQALEKTLASLEELLIESNAKLVIVDSIASLVRKEFDVQSMRHRSEHLSAEAAQLKYLATLFNIPVVVSNQVTTSFARNDDVEAYVTAALGNTWAHSVNTRLVLEYNEQSKDRTIRIAKSPKAPHSGCSFCITAAGPVGGSTAGCRVVVDKDPSSVPVVLARSLAPSEGQPRDMHTLVLGHQP